MAGPDFLVVGLHKSGTTWLHRNLAEDSRFVMPLVKEVNYFNFLECPNDREWIQREYYRDLLSTIEGERTSGNVPCSGLGEPLIDVALRQARAPHTPEWYEGLFSTKTSGQAAGEVSPNYAGLAIDAISRIRSKYNLHVFLLLRNPVDRLWSALRMELGRRGLEASDSRGIVELLGDAGMWHLRLDYGAVVSNWKEAFGESLHLLCYEEIAVRPEDVLDNFARTLRVGPGDPWYKARTIFNKGDPVAIPTWLGHWAFEALEGSLNFMQANFPTVPSSWSMDTDDRPPSVRNARGGALVSPTLMPPETRQAPANGLKDG